MILILLLLDWGCGAFRGDPELKAIIQLMCAAQVGRTLMYYTWGDQILADGIVLLLLLSLFNSKHPFDDVL